MARRRQQARSSREDGNGDEAIALLSQEQTTEEQNLGRTGAEDADQYDEHAPLNAGASQGGLARSSLECVSASICDVLPRVRLTNTFRSKFLSRFLDLKRVRYVLLVGFATVLALLVIIATAGGTVVYISAPKNGLSPPWYPSREPFQNYVLFIKFTIP